MALPRSKLTPCLSTYARISYIDFLDQHLSHELNILPENIIAAMADYEMVLEENPCEEVPYQKGKDLFSETKNSYLTGWKLHLTTIG